MKSPPTKNSSNNTFILFVGLALIGLAYVLLHSALRPEWLIRLILYCLYIILGSSWFLWMGLSPRSVVVSDWLLQPEHLKLRQRVSLIARTMFTIGGIVLFSVLFPLYKDVSELVRYGSKVLIIKRSLVALYPSPNTMDLPFLYESVYFVGEKPEARHGYPFSFWDRQLRGSTWDFLILKNSGEILEVRSPGQNFDLQKH